MKKFLAVLKDGIFSLSSCTWDKEKSKPSMESNAWPVYCSDALATELLGDFM